MKYTLYHPLTTTTWFSPDQNRSKTHIIKKLSQHGSCRLAVIHHRQAPQQNPKNWIKLQASPGGREFIARRFFLKNPVSFA